MKKGLLSFAALGFLLAALVLAAAPALADSVEQKITALEQELTRLKTEQMELRKEALEAAPAMPTFSYRPGRGVTITAADRSWSLALSHEAHFMMPFNEGKDQAGRTNGEVMGRRFRQEWTLCLNNCFYTWISRLDLDGFNTQSDLQRGMFEVHFEQINPWLPTFYLGMDIPARMSPFRQGSGATGAQMEYDILSRNQGFNTGRTGTGWGLVWEELPLIPALGIPGRGDANIVIGSTGAADDGKSILSDKKNVTLYFRVDPFSKVKNPWISGFSYSIGAWFCTRDGRMGFETAQAEEDSFGCLRNRTLRDHGPGGRQTIFDSGLFGNGISGTQVYLTPGIQWRYQFYTLRAIMGFMNYDVRNKTGAGTGGVGLDHEARNFLIAHDIFVWSPKGLLTGSPSTPGSVLFGYHFERNDANCGHTRPLAPCAAGGEFSRNRLILNEWDLWYFFMPGKSLGISFLWYDASNLRSGAAQAQANLLSKSGLATTAGKGGDWVDVILGLRVNF
jgi:hypothetical protein